MSEFEIKCPKCGALVTADDVMKDHVRQKEKLYKQKLDNENRQLLKIGFPEVYFLEKRTLKTLSDFYLKREPIFRNVRDILTHQTNTSNLHTHTIKRTCKFQSFTI